MIKTFLKAIIENDWTPVSLLDRVTDTEWVDYSVPQTVFGCTSYGYLRENTERTQLGKFVDNIPGLISVLYLIIHYIFFSIVWITVCPTICILKLVFRLFTRKWKDV